jgi:hypothetical protein
MKEVGVVITEDLYNKTVKKVKEPTAKDYRKAQFEKTYASKAITAMDKGLAKADKFVASAADKFSLRVDYSNIQSGVDRLTKVFNADPREVRAQNMSRARAARRSKVVNQLENARLAQVSAQDVAQRQALQAQIVTMNEAEAMKFLEANTQGKVEIGEDGTVYANKWNNKLMNKQIYFNAIEAKKRFHEMPKDWEQRRYELEQIQMQRRRATEKRDNIMQTHKGMVNMPMNWLTVDGTKAEADNIWSKNNPNNKNVFDERGKQTIMNAPNVFDERDPIYKSMNILNAPNVFGGSLNPLDEIARKKKLNQTTKLNLWGKA